MCIFVRQKTTYTTVKELEDLGGMFQLKNKEIEFEALNYRDVYPDPHSKDIDAGRGVFIVQKYSPEEDYKIKRFSSRSPVRLQQLTSYGTQGGSLTTGHDVDISRDVNSSTTGQSSADGIYNPVALPGNTGNASSEYYRTDNKYVNTPQFTNTSVHTFHGKINRGDYMLMKGVVENKKMNEISDDIINIEEVFERELDLSLIHISEPTRPY